MRGFGDTQGAQVDTSQYADNPPTIKMEDAAYRVFVCHGARIVNTSYGDRALLTVGFPDEPVSYDVDGNENPAQLYQIWCTARIINQVKPVIQAKQFPFTAFITEVTLGRGTSYELADPKELGTPLNTSTSGRASQPVIQDASDAMDPFTPGSAEETAHTGTARTMQSPKSGQQQVRPSQARTR